MQKRLKGLKRIWCVSFSAVPGHVDIVESGKLGVCFKKLDLEPGSRPEWLLEKIPYNKIIPDGSPTMRTYIGFECAKSTGIISLLVTLAIVMFMYFKTDLDQKGFLVVMAAMLYTLVSLFFDYLLPIMMLWLLNWMIHKSGWGAQAYVKI